jgi:hypothetical protein
MEARFVLFARRCGNTVLASACGGRLHARELVCKAEPVKSALCVPAFGSRFVHPTRRSGNAVLASACWRARAIIFFRRGSAIETSHQQATRSVLGSRFSVPRLQVA